METESKAHRAWFFASIALCIALIVVALRAVYVDIDSAVTNGYLRDTVQLQQWRSDDIQPTRETVGR